MSHLIGVLIWILASVGAPVAQCDNVDEDIVAMCYHPGPAYSEEGDDEFPGARVNSSNLISNGF